MHYVPLKIDLRDSRVFVNLIIIIIPQQLITVFHVTKIIRFIAKTIIVKLVIDTSERCNGHFNIGNFKEAFTGSNL